MLAVMLSSALVTEIIGIHALSAPSSPARSCPSVADFARCCAIGSRAFSSVFLLPLFFAYTGLRTRIGLFLDDVGSWAICLVIILVANAGELGSTVSPHVLPASRGATRRHLAR